MKLEELYNSLKEAAYKLGITISEQNLKNAGFRVKSGLCKVKDKSIFIMDKSQTIRDKTELLALCIKNMPHEEIYIVPDVRDYIKRIK
ncbi:MAG: hypothetical protein HQK79_16170 [Desulfobacterales bacterium]|nr:hypothetical protein [Desulfobacterales bacterium]